jgi:hypothetical protein
MYMPTELAPLFLYGRLTPQEALIAVHSALIPIKGLESFKPLVDWLHMDATSKWVAVI